jgi:hypothetical protein
LRWEGLRQLAQRVEVSYHLEALDLDETRAYIRYRIERAEGPDPDLFSDLAIREIYNYSKGIPRLINAVCHMSLVYGMADEVKRIDRPLIVNVLKDRSQWDLLPVEKDSTGKEPPRVFPAFADSVKIEGILRNMESKLGLFVEIAASSRAVLEEFASRLPERKIKGESTNPSEGSMGVREQWDLLLQRLIRIEKILARGVESQSRLIELLSSQTDKTPTKRFWTRLIENLSAFLSAFFKRV